MTDERSLSPEEFRELQRQARAQLPPMEPERLMEIEIVTASGRVLTNDDIDDFVAEAEHGYDVSSGEPRLFECCSHLDMFNGACPCNDPKHADDPMHPLAPR
jgi:hypothetical protein